jgi:hypothetical protein
MWTVADTEREALYQSLAVMDWAQTRTIATYTPTKGGFNESNAILGTHPSTNKVNKYFVFTGLAHAAVAYMLSPTYRRIFELSTISLEVGAVGNNMTLGVGMKF